MPLYLDYNATTPIHPEVLEAIVAVYRDNFGNAGSRTHIYGQNANQAVEKARGSITSILGVDKASVVFTSGATEANNISILGLARWGAENSRRHIISTAIEHKAVLEPLGYLTQQGFEVDLVRPDYTGRVNARSILDLVRPDTLMVSVMHANNETGVIQPVQEIGDALADTPVYFHVDAAQTFGKMVPELQSLRYNMLSISGHKIYGPQGIGALVMRQKKGQRIPLKPVTFGGGQEGGLRPGTLPVALIVGLGKATEIAAKHQQEWQQQNIQIKQDILNQISSLNCVINGSLDFSLPNCLNLSFIGVDSEALMIAVKNDLAFSNGSACTSSEYKPSHVLTAMGLRDEIIQEAVRISWGPLVSKVNMSPIKLIVSSLQ